VERFGSHGTFMPIVSGFTSHGRGDVGCQIKPTVACARSAAAFEICGWGLSHERLAELSGIHENHLRRIELGQVNPTVVVLFHISDALQVSVDDIISAVRLRPKQSR